MAENIRFGVKLTKKDGVDAIYCRVENHSKSGPLIIWAFGGACRIFLFGPAGNPLPKTIGGSIGGGSAAPIIISEGESYEWQINPLYAWGDEWKGGSELMVTFPHGDVFEGSISLPTQLSVRLDLKKGSPQEWSWAEAAAGPIHAPGTGWPLSSASSRIPLNSDSTKTDPIAAPEKTGHPVRGYWIAGGILGGLVALRMWLLRRRRKKIG